MTPPNPPYSPCRALAARDSETQVWKEKKPNILVAASDLFLVNLEGVSVLHLELVVGVKSS
jgi:hypothetical protein